MSTIHTHTHTHTVTHRRGNVEKVAGSHVMSLVSIFFFVFFHLNQNPENRQQKNGEKVLLKNEPINNRRYSCCRRQSLTN